MRHVLRDHQIGIRRKQPVARKRKINSVAEFPAAQIHRLGPLIVQFDVFVAAVAGNRSVHDFVEHHVADANVAVRQAGRSGGQAVELIRAVRVTASGNAVFLPAELDGVEHAGGVRTLEINRFPGCAQREAHLRLVENDIAPGRDNRVRNDKFVRVRVVGQDAAGYIHRLIAVVVEFDVIEQRVVCVRQKLVDEHRAQGAGAIRFDGAGRTACDIANVPRFGKSLPVGRTRQHQRMPGAVGGDRPRRFAGVGDFKVDGAGVVAQPHRAGVFQRAGVRPNDVGDAVNALDVPRRPGHDQEPASWQNRVGRKTEINVAGEPIAADVLDERV